MGYGTSPVKNACWVLSPERTGCKMVFRRYENLIQRMEEEVGESCQSNSGDTVNITEELKVLLRVYEESEQSLLEREEGIRDILDNVMQKYLDAKTERKTVSDRLTALRNKLGLDKDEEEDDE